MGENAPEESGQEPEAPRRRAFPRIPLPKVQPKGVARSAANRVNAKWITILLTAVFLTVSAAFGGLARAETEETELAVIEPGAEFAGELMSITVEQAVVEDYDDASFFAESGTRRLMLLVTVVNHWDVPVHAPGTVLSAVTVPSIPGEPEQHEAEEEDPAALVEELLGEADTPDEGELATAEEAIPESRNTRNFEISVTRVDDGTVQPWLQPEIPVQLVLEWSVDESLFGHGDDLQVVLHELEVFTYQIFSDESLLQPGAAAAEVYLPVEDAEAGEGTL